MSKKRKVVSKKGKKPPVTTKVVKHVNKKLSKAGRKGKFNATVKSSYEKIKKAKQNVKEQKQKRIEVDWEKTADRKEQLENEDMDIVETAVEAAENAGPRSFGEANLKPMLPIKSLNGELLERFIDMDDDEYAQAFDDFGEEVEEEKEGTEAKNSHAEPTLDLQPDTSQVEILAKIHALKTDYKRRIASLSLLVIQAPEQQIFKLRDLVRLSLGEEVAIQVRYEVKKLAIASLLEVFLDILPGYRIRERSEGEMKEKLAKETRGMVEFEETLLRYYKKYLQCLEKQTKSFKRKKSDVKASKGEKLGLLAAKCLCKLMVEKHHFNMGENIINVVGRLCTLNNPQLLDLGSTAFRELFLVDRHSGRTTLAAVRAISKLVRDSGHHLPPKLLEALLELKVKEVNKNEPMDEAEKREKERKRKHLQSVSRKEKKYKKELEKLETELRETEAEENRKTRLKMNTAIMDQVFHIYFRVLRRLPETPLLAPVLEGLSKFVHLINVEFLDDLVVSLEDLIAQGRLKTLDSLHAIRTVFVVLSGEGRSINIDPHRMYRLTYALLPKIVSERNQTSRLKQFKVLIDCLEIMICKRRKQVNLGRVGAFAIRLCLLGLTVPTEYLLAILSMVRKFFVAHPQLEWLVDLEETKGSGKFMPAVEDPDHANALSSDLKLLTLLKSHEDIRVRSFAKDILANLPVTGPGRLTPELALKEPASFLPESEAVKVENVTTNGFEIFPKKIFLSKRDGSLVREIHKKVESLYTK